MAAGRDADPRSRDQQRHDVFAGIVDTAARALDMPQLGGAAPVVAVAVTQREPGNRHRVRVHRGDPDLDAGGAAVRLHRRDAEDRLRPGRADHPVGFPGTHLHRPATPGDHPAGWGVLHPRLPHARRPVRDPPCRSGRRRRTHPHRQRDGVVLVPPPHPGHLRLAIPDGQRTTRGEIPTLARRLRKAGTPPDDPPPSDKPTPTANDERTASRIRRKSLPTIRCRRLQGTTRCRASRSRGSGL